MTHKTLSGLILIVFVSLISMKSFSTVHAVKITLIVEASAGMNAQDPGEELPFNKMPFFPPSESKESHGKAVSVNSDELPHIHKFHKERVKKIKKHHSKFWILSQVLLVLCHIYILILAFMHVTH